MNYVRRTTITKPPSIRKKRWFRFSLRTMLLATRCCASGWDGRSMLLVNNGRPSLKFGHGRTCTAPTFEIVPGRLPNSPILNPAGTQSCWDWTTSSMFVNLAAIGMHPKMLPLCCRTCATLHGFAL